MAKIGKVYWVLFLDFLDFLLLLFIVKKDILYIIYYIEISDVD